MNTSFGRELENLSAFLQGIRGEGLKFVRFDIKRAMI
jgi:hypothetical protein